MQLQPVGSNGSNQASESTQAIISSNNESLPLVKTIFNQLQMAVPCDDKRLAITEKDCTHLNNALDNYIANCPEESTKWMESIKTTCNQFVQLRGMELQNQKELDDATQQMNEHIEGLKKVNVEKEELTKKRDEYSKNRIGTLKKLDENLIEVQNQVAKSKNVLTTALEEYAGIPVPSVATVSKVSSYGSALLAVYAAYSFNPAVGQCLPIIANATIAGCASATYYAIPSISLGLSYLGFNLVSKVAHNMMALEQGRDKILEEKRKSESNFNFIEQELKKEEDEIQKKLDSHTTNLETNQKISVDAQDKKDTIQSIKNDAIAEVVTDLFANNMKALRKNEEMMGKCTENEFLKLVQEQSYPLMQNFVGSILSIYALKADSMLNTLQGACNSPLSLEGRVEEVI